MQQKRIADKLNIMAGVVCAVGIISSLVIAIALFANDSQAFPPCQRKGQVPDQRPQILVMRNR